MIQGDSAGNLVQSWTSVPSTPCGTGKVTNFSRASVSLYGEWGRGGREEAVVRGVFSSQDNSFMALSCHSCCLSLESEGPISYRRTQPGLPTCTADVSSLSLGLVLEQPCSGALQGG